MTGWQWHKLDNMQNTASHSGQTANNNICRPDALPDTQPTVPTHTEIQHIKIFMSNNTLISK